MTEVGEKLDLDIARIMSDGKGTGFTEDGVLVLIEGVDEDDESVQVEVVRIYEETIFAKKISTAKTDARKTTRKDLTSSPYELDEDDDDDYGYDDDDDEDED